jgi:hypothetical protein
LCAAYEAPPRRCARPRRLVSDGATKASNGRLDPQAPLSKWKSDGVYDTARECDERYHRDLYLAEDWKLATGNTRVWKDVQEEQCIASDDPRLKEK